MAGEWEPSELLDELRHLLDELPVPVGEDHPHQDVLPDCRRDLAWALATASGRPAALEVLDRLVSGEVDLDFDESSDPELTRCWERFQQFPLPTDTDHRYLREIVSAVDAYRLLFVALSHEPPPS